MYTPLTRQEKVAVRKLFMPWQCGNMTLKNRFFRAATWLAACGQKGHATEVSASRQLEVAQGGASLVISEYAAVEEASLLSPGMWGLFDESEIAPLKSLTDKIHEAGSHFFVQLVHLGNIETTTEEDIERIIKAFARAAVIAKDGGADGVEIHAAHGFLLNQFMSPILNKRNDNWGGDEARRLNITKAVFKAIRSAVGDSYPVWAKFSIGEGVEGGYTEEDGVRMALNLLDEGLDGIEISCGSARSIKSKRPCMVGVTQATEAPWSKWAKQIKQARPDKTVILTGGLRTLKILAKLFEDGVCDAFSLSRPFICESDLVNRWAEDDDRPSACISCNACFKTAKDGAIYCPVMKDKIEGNWDAL